MAALATTFHALPAAPAFSASASAAAGSRTRMTSAVAMIPSASMWVTRQGRPCYPRQHSFGQGPGRVRVLFAHQSLPQNQPQQQPQQQPQKQQQEDEGSGSVQNPSQNPQEQQSGNPATTTTTASAQAQQQQRQQNSSWASTSSPCAPRNTCTSSPLYGDMLAPWFPRDRSLEQMLSTAERLMGDMMIFGPQGGRFRRGRSTTTPDNTRGAHGLVSLALRRPWDAQEDDKAYTLRLDLPGLGREDVNVRVDDTNTLFILAQKEAKDKEDASSDGANIRFRSSRNFQTKLKLPDNVRKEEVSAEMKDGVLTVLLPKIPPQEPGSNGIDVLVA